MTNEPPVQWYRTGDSIKSTSGSTAEIDAARERAKIVFASIFEGTVGAESLPEKLQKVINQITDILNGLIVTPINEAVQGVKDWFDALLNFRTGTAWNTVNSAKAIAELQVKMALGATFSDDYDRQDNPTTLGNGWVQGGVGQALGLIDGAARLDNTGSAVGKRYAICPTLADSNNHSVTAAVNPAGVAVGVMTSIFLRANADLTEFVYANIYGKSAYIGRGTRAGNVWSFGGGTDWKAKTSGFTLPEGALVEFKAVDARYTLLVNGQTILEHDDVSGYPIDDTHRTVGFQSETKIIGLFPQYSWGLAAFTVRNVLSTSLDAISNTATSAEQTALAAAQQIAELRGENNAGGNNGVSISEVFPGSQNDFDPAVWTDLGPITNQTGHLDNSASILTSASVAGKFPTLHDTPLETDAQSVSAVITRTAQATNSPMMLLLRAAADLSSFVYVEVYKNDINIGRGSWNLSTGVPTLNQWEGVIWSAKQGNTVEVRVTGDTYAITVNGTPVLTYTDSPRTATVGASNRHVGMVHSLSIIFGIKVTGFGIFAFNASDIEVPQYKGTVWNLFQSSLTPGPNLAHGYNRVPATFDAEREISNVTIESLALGNVRIKKEGTYLISIRYQLTRPTDNDNFMALLYSWDGVVGGSFNLVDVGPENGDIGVHTVGATFQRYCLVGEVLAPGFYYNKGAVEPANQIVGDNLGTVTYFKGVLVGS